MEHTIEHSYGRTRTFPTASDACEAILAEYGYDTLFREGDRRTTVWACEADAEGDDGSNAVATITPPLRPKH